MTDSQSEAQQDLDAARETAFQLHMVDLYKTQTSHQENSERGQDVLILVKYPEFAKKTSCFNTSFQTAKLLFTRDQILNTGSPVLEALLLSERHQRQAKKAAGLLPNGISHVLDLSPTTDEVDYTIALHCLTITTGIKLWYRTMADGNSPLDVAGHDDACHCSAHFNWAGIYPQVHPPTDAHSPVGVKYIYDTKSWPIEDHYDISDFCQLRWASNTVRLLQTITKPPGHKGLLIDSAPRMWTLVGLFRKLEMKNHALLRDEVVEWFNTDKNRLFVEVCPEETLRVGLIIKAPCLAEAAFRILVNEYALEVASGRPRTQPPRTIFGRECARFSGTDETESILMMIEHAGTAMADRCREALDKLCREDFLDTLGVPQWQELRALDDIIPKTSSDELPTSARVGYDMIMKLIQEIFSREVKRLLDASLHDEWHTERMGACLTPSRVEELRAYTVNRRELITTQSLDSVYTSLNKYQRALLPFTWQRLRELGYVSYHQIQDAFDPVCSFFLSEFTLERAFELLPSLQMWQSSPDATGIFVGRLFDRAFRSLSQYATQLLDRGNSGFEYTATPHLLLSLDKKEMSFLQMFDDDENQFKVSVPPDTDFGPAGPGPAFHTGQTQPSMSGLDSEELVAHHDRLSSVVAQDGKSRARRFHSDLGRSSASEVFTDSEMSAAYVDAEYAIPAEHQARGQILAEIVEEEEEEMGVPFSSENDDVLVFEDEKGNEIRVEDITKHIGQLDVDDDDNDVSEDYEVVSLSQEDS